MQNSLMFAILLSPSKSTSSTCCVSPSALPITSSLIQENVAHRHAELVPDTSQVLTMLVECARVLVRIMGPNTVT